MAERHRHHERDRNRDSSRRERRRDSPSPRRVEDRKRRSKLSPDESRDRRRSRSPHSRKDARERRGTSEEGRHSRHRDREHRQSDELTTQDSRLEGGERSRGSRDRKSHDSGERRARDEGGDRRSRDSGDGSHDRGDMSHDQGDRSHDSGDMSHDRGILGSPPSASDEKPPIRKHDRGRGKRGGRWGREEEEDYSKYQFGGGSAAAGDGDGSGEEEGKEDEDKAAPDYGLSGKLTAETNTFKGEVIKYNEPLEARQPKTRWRFYQFKGDELVNVLYIHRQSAYLIGRDRKIVDFPVDHPSCSKQHSVLQYRLMNYVKDDGTKGRRVRPYIIDLDSTNGTYLNNNRIDPSRYYELQEKDMIKFGFSSREYVLLHENSRISDDELDDD